MRAPRPIRSVTTTMNEYLVTMTTHVPDGTSEQSVDLVKNREAVRANELAAQGHLLRLWRPPLQPGEWRTIGLFAADDDIDLEKNLASMPLRVWRTDEVTPLSHHPNDPGPRPSAPAELDRNGVPDHLLPFSPSRHASEPRRQHQGTRSAPRSSARGAG